MSGSKLKWDGAGGAWSGHERGHARKLPLHTQTPPSIPPFQALALVAGFKELPENGALLMYISADGCFSQSKLHDDGKCPRTAPSPHSMR